MKAVGFIIKIDGFDKEYEQKLINETDKFNFDIIINEDTDCLEYLFWHEEDGLDDYYKKFHSVFPNTVFTPMFFDPTESQLSVHFEKPVDPVAVFFTGIDKDVLFDDKTCRNLFDVISEEDVIDSLYEEE